MKCGRSTIVCSAIVNGMETKILNNTRGGHCSGAALRVKCTRRVEYNTADVQDVSSICVGARARPPRLLRVCEQRPLRPPNGEPDGPQLRAAIIVTQCRVRGYWFFTEMPLCFWHERPTTTRVWRTASIMFRYDGTRRHVFVHTGVDGGVGAEQGRPRTGFGRQGDDERFSAYREAIRVFLFWRGKKALRLKSTEILNAC